MPDIFQFVEAHRRWFDLAHAASSIVNLFVWTIGVVVLVIAWRRNAIANVRIGPVNFQMQAAEIDTAAAARDWQARGQSPAKPLDVQHLRRTVAHAFSPEIIGNLIGKSILWVDDRPNNNMLAVRALNRLNLDIEQAVSTEQGLAAMQQRHFDLVISDMGRGTDLRAGYDLLAKIRAMGNDVPFLIFAGSDKPEFRREAKERGAQLSTNDMLELIDTIVALLGKPA